MPKPHATDIPHIKITDFRCYKKKLISNHRTGTLAWKSVHGIDVNSEFTVRLGFYTGYVHMRYMWAQKPVSQLIRLATWVNNYGHRKWDFVCPTKGCGNKCWVLFFLNGPNWECKKCLKLHTPLRNHKPRDFDFKETKKDISSSSVKRKIKALDKYLKMRMYLSKKLG